MVTRVLYDADRKSMRRCGECTLCCKLLPVRELKKGANERCQYQRHGQGCTVYHTVAMPAACGLWNCRWLVNDDAAELPRPDRSHYVLDIAPDYVTLVEDNGKNVNVQVAQIWCDPNYPDAWQDPALKRWVERRALDGIAAIVRFNSKDAIVVFAPPMASDGKWHIKSTAMREKTHSFADIERALGGSISIKPEENS